MPFVDAPPGAAKGNTGFKAAVCYVYETMQPAQAVQADELDEDEELFDTGQYQ